MLPTDPASPGLGCHLDHRGSPQPGRLKKVQGIGWYLEEENIAQVSTNLLDFEATPLHAVYEEVCRDAEVGSARCSPSKCSAHSWALLSLILCSSKLGRDLNHM